MSKQITNYPLPVSSKWSRKHGASFYLASALCMDRGNWAVADVSVAVRKRFNYCGGVELGYGRCRYTPLRTFDWGYTVVLDSLGLLNMQPQMRELLQGRGLDDSPVVVLNRIVDQDWDKFKAIKWLAKSVMAEVIQDSLDSSRRSILGTDVHGGMLHEMFKLAGRGVHCRKGPIPLRKTARTYTNFNTMNDVTETTLVAGRDETDWYIEEYCDWGHESVPKNDEFKRAYALPKLRLNTNRLTYSHNAYDQYGYY